jgi:hypothetical protein
MEDIKQELELTIYKQALKEDIRQYLIQALKESKSQKVTKRIGTRWQELVKKNISSELYCTYNKDKYSIAFRSWGGIIDYDDGVYQPNSILTTEPTVNDILESMNKSYGYANSNNQYELELKNIDKIEKLAQEIHDKKNELNKNFIANTKDIFNNHISYKTQEYLKEKYYIDFKNF